jgi:hypothetical protein
MPKDSGPDIDKRAGAISDWSREFEEPIVPPDGQKLLTLRDAATLAAEGRSHRAGMAAMEALILVAENGGARRCCRALGCCGH